MPVAPYKQPHSEVNVQSWLAKVSRRVALAGCSKSPIADHQSATPAYVRQLSSNNSCSLRSRQSPGYDRTRRKPVSDSKISDGAASEKEISRTRQRCPSSSVTTRERERLSLATSFVDSIGCDNISIRVMEARCHHDHKSTNRRLRAARVLTPRQRRTSCPPPCAPPRGSAGATFPDSPCRRGDRRSRRPG